MSNTLRKSDVYALIIEDIMEIFPSYNVTLIDVLAHIDEIREEAGEIITYLIFSIIKSIYYCKQSLLEEKDVDGHLFRTYYSLIKELEDVYLVLLENYEYES